MIVVFKLFGFSGVFFGGGIVLGVVIVVIFCFGIYKYKGWNFGYV